MYFNWAGMACRPDFRTSPLTQQAFGSLGPRVHFMANCFGSVGGTTVPINSSELPLLPLLAPWEPQRSSEYSPSPVKVPTQGPPGASRGPGKVPTQGPPGASPDPDKTPTQGLGQIPLGIIVTIMPHGLFGTHPAAATCAGIACGALGPWGP